MEPTHLIALLGLILVLTSVALLSLGRKKHKPICKYDGTNLKRQSLNTYFCPKCGKVYLDLNGKTEEKK